MVCCNKHKIFLLISVTVFLHFVSFTDISAQNVVVKGYIRDELSHESLPYATIYLPEKKTGISANQYGYFSLIVSAVETEIEVSYVGYEAVKKFIEFKNDTTINIFLSPPSIKEVVISARRNKAPSSGINRTAISMAKLREIPPFLGEYDLIKALALTPGVNTSGEISSGLMVRGGTPDQNLVLLDGATTYNNTHLFGFISNFNPSSISSAELIKGGFPPQYGDRLSSILNVTMKEGNRREYNTNLTIGPINSQFTTEGPIIRDKSSFIISGRVTELSLITWPLYLLMGKDSDRFNYLMYDLNAKINYSFSDHERIFLSYYSGSDIWKARSNEIWKHVGVNLDWNNSTASLRYTKDFTNGLFSLSQLTYSHFTFKYNIKDKSLTTPPEYETVSAATASSVEAYSARQHFEITTGTRSKIRTGLEITTQILHPDYYKLKNVNFGSDIPSYRNNSFYFHTGAAYAEELYSPYSWLTVSGGLRYSARIIKNKSYHSLEPRVEIQFNSRHETYYNLAYTYMSQPLFQLTNTGQGLPIDIWVPVTSEIPPAKAGQWSAGVKKALQKEQLSLQAEIYYKRTSGLLEYNQGISFISNIAKSWDQNIVSGGIGKAYGFEFLIIKENGRLNGWLGYTLSRNYRKFDEINYGKWYFARYDRTHDVELTGAYKLNSSWKLSGTFVFSTGQPATLATTVHEDLYGNKIQVFTARNNLRMPPYHRLDISFEKEYVTKRNRPASFSFGAYNLYNRTNPFYVTLEEIPVRDANNQVIKYKSRYMSGGLPGFIPFINYSIKF